jgi:hypothetical protein
MVGDLIVWVIVITICVMILGIAYEHIPEEVKKWLVKKLKKVLKKQKQR